MPGVWAMAKHSPSGGAGLCWEAPPAWDKFPQLFPSLKCDHFSGCNLLPQPRPDRGRNWEQLRRTPSASGKGKIWQPARSWSTTCAQIHKGQTPCHVSCPQQKVRKAGRKWETLLLVGLFFWLGWLIPSLLFASSWLVSSSDLGVARSRGFRGQSSLPGVLLPPALPSAAPCCRDYCSLLTSQPGLDVSFRITGLFTAQVPIMLPQCLKRKRFAS